MKRAIAHVCSQIFCLPSKIIIDAVPVSFDSSPLADIEVQWFPFAEQLSISVAAASIVAKVKRDEIMREFEKIFPGYALADHKGYATSKHRECVLSLGASIIHRRSFMSRIPEGEREAYEQIELFCRSNREFSDAL